MKERFPTVAGTFYPSDKKELAKMINKFLNEQKPKKIAGKLKALIVPHAGYIYSGSVAANGYNLLKHIRPRKIILLGPSHSFRFSGVATDDSEYWLTPLGKIKVIPIEVRDLIIMLPEAHRMEHSLEVQLPFLQTVLQDFEILPLVTGQVNPSSLADELIKKIDTETVIVVSSDLSHYYPYEQAKRIDAIANEAIPALDLKRVETEVQACGKTAILTLMYVAKKFGWKGKLVCYLNSGDTGGGKEEVVGYGCYAFFE